MNNASNSVKIGQLACATAVPSVVIPPSKVKAPAIIKKELPILLDRSVDPFLRQYMNRGTKLMPAFKLNEPLNGGCIGQIIESKNDKFKVGEYVLGNSG